MKQTLLLFLVILSSASAAQTMLDQGNVWTYCTIGYDNPYGEGQPIEQTFTKYYIKGDTVISGKQYKQIWVQYATVVNDNGESYFSEREYLMGVREENGIVYTNDEEYRILAEITDPSDYFAWHINRHEDNEYILYDFNEPQPDGIIPYIGSKNTLFVNFPQPIDGKYHKQSLNLFLRNGMLEYKSPDFYPDPFFPDIVNSIEQSHTLSPHQDGNHIYNLQGQRTSRPTKGIHIIGGRKVLVK